MTAGNRPSRSRPGWDHGLAARGLAFNEEKTRVVHLEEGFGFLGFNVRRYGQKLLIKPSAGAVRRIRKRLADGVRALRGANATAVIRTIAPIVRGWSALPASVGDRKRSMWGPLRS